MNTGRLRSAHLLYPSMASPANLEQQYRLYIDYLNQGRVHELETFVHDTVVYNGESMSRQGYQDLIADSMRAIPDFGFFAHFLTAHY